MYFSKAWNLGFSLAEQLKFRLFEELLGFDSPLPDFRLLGREPSLDGSPKGITPSLHYKPKGKQQAFWGPYFETLGRMMLAT